MAAITLEFILILIGAFLISLFLTPIIRLLAPLIGAVDHPNARRINTKPMPSSGGIAIIFSFLVATLLLMPQIFPLTYFNYILPVVLGGLMVGVTGFIDDIYELKALPKLAGILGAALLVYCFTDFHFDSFKLPFGGPLLIFPDWLTFVATMIWIVGITNAINFLDGLDGLVSGVAIINLTTLGVVSHFFLFDSNIYITLTIFVLIAAIIGFFPTITTPPLFTWGMRGHSLLGS